ncbi:MAG: hypothetical protein CL910_09675 [Deltaproteobacteria bacterium]|jgi:hypothetical protein|nr:hypothetical protein [Deltaproteobacteria bacterium]
MHLRRRQLLAVPIFLLLSALAHGEEELEGCAPLPEASPRITQQLANPPEPGDARAALMLLPKAALAQLGSPSEILADGVEIVSSYWSPVLCASVTRVRGPADMAPVQWAPGLPESGTLVPDDTYHTGATAAARGPEAGTAAEDAAAVPDPYRPLQFALDELGVDASLPVTRGGGTRIAVLDSTPQLDHPDLGTVEIAARFVPEEPARHGTLVTGILAARPGNGFGIVGLVPEASVLAIPVCQPGPDRSERGDVCALFDVLQGLDVAWTRRVHIVNLSLAGPSNPLLQGATDRLEGLGVTLVAAAGNDGGEEALYPAAYASVIGVGATGRGGKAFAQGNRGPGNELSAPGVDIVSTAPGGGFAFADGTSLATAHVSGVLALVASAGGDLAAARRAVFQAARRHPRATRSVAVLVPVCEALTAVGQPCPPSP